MIYEEAEYYAAYSNYVVDPVSGIRYANARIPEFPENKITFRLGYHPLRYRPQARIKAERLLDGHLNLSEKDGVVIIGGAYGWLGEALEAFTGCSCVSVDPSKFIQETKSMTGGELLLESLEDQGYLYSNIGDFLYERLKDDVPLSKIPVVQDIADASKALCVPATAYITEEVWQILNNKDQEAYQKAAEGRTLVHIINGVII